MICPSTVAARSVRRHADRRAGLSLRVLGDAVAHFPRQVQAAAIVFEQVDDPQALLVVIEAARHQTIDDALAGVAERRVAEIVAERDRLGELFVQPQHLGDCPGNLRHLERVRQARAVVIAGRREEHLRLVLQPSERLAVDDAVPVTLKRRPDIVFVLEAEAAARFGAPGGLWREDVTLALFELFAQARHASSRRKLVPCASGARQRARPASGRGRRMSHGCRDCGPPRRADPSQEAGRIRARDRCSAVVGSLP